MSTKRTPEETIKSIEQSLETPDKCKCPPCKCKGFVNGLSPGELEIMARSYGNLAANLEDKLRLERGYFSNLMSENSRLHANLNKLRSASQAHLDSTDHCDDSMIENKFPCSNSDCIHCNLHRVLEDTK